MVSCNAGHSPPPGQTPPAASVENSIYCWHAPYPLAWNFMWEMRKISNKNGTIEEYIETLYSSAKCWRAMQWFEENMPCHRPGSTASENGSQLVSVTILGNRLPQAFSLHQWHRSPRFCATQSATTCSRVKISVSCWCDNQSLRNDIGPSCLFLRVAPG